MDSSRSSCRKCRAPSIVVCAALVVPPDSDVYTPQQLAGKLIGVPYYFGTHYLTMQMLDGFMPRDMIKTCRAPNGSAARYEAMRNHEVAATTLTEPYISLAEKAGCRIVCEALFHGTEVVSDAVDADTYAAFNRAVREAVRRINADKRSYIHYFLDHHNGQHEGLEALTIDDFRPSRIQLVDPMPIPEDELRRTYQWMRSWDMLDDIGEDGLIDVIRQSEAHGAAAEGASSQPRRCGVGGGVAERGMDTARRRARGQRASIHGIGPVVLFILIF